MLLYCDSPCIKRLFVIVIPATSAFIHSFYSLLMTYACYRIFLPHFIGIHGLLQDWRFWSNHISYLFTFRALPPLALNLLVFIFMFLLSKLRSLDNSFILISIISNKSPWIYFVRDPKLTSYFAALEFGN